MKILVTGATGLIGSTVTQRLVERGDDVRILRRETSTLDLLGEYARHVEHAPGDVLDTESLQSAMRGVQQVYHVAGFIGFDDRRERDTLFRVNVGGTANVINAALHAGIERLVHTSSVAAFGRPENPAEIITESTPWRPSKANTDYAVSKYEAELEIHRGIAEGLDAVMVNPALVFGVGRPQENTMRLVETVRSGFFPAIPPGGTNVVDVLDVADGHLRAMEQGRTGERYFLGSENRSWKEITETLAEAFGVEPPRRIASARAMMAVATLTEAWAMLTRTRPLLTRSLARQSTRFWRYDHRKAVEELGCTFRPFEATARRIAEAVG